MSLVFATRLGQSTPQKSFRRLIKVKILRSLCLHDLLTKAAQVSTEEAPAPRFNTPRQVVKQKPDHLRDIWDVHGPSFETRVLFMSDFFAIIGRERAAFAFLSLWLSDPCDHRGRPTYGICMRQQQCLGCVQHAYVCSFETQISFMADSSAIIGGGEAVLPSPALLQPTL